MFFHRCLQARDGAADASGALAANPRRLWSVCFLLAPFGEAVTGFGIGYIIALTGLRRIGIGGLPALVLGLYSQSLVPWGALAIGTTVGATLAGLTPNQLGLGSAILQVPIHAFYLVLYWRFAREAGVRVSLAQKVDDAVWTAPAARPDLAAQLLQRRRDRGRGGDRAAARRALLARRAARPGAARARRSRPTRPTSPSPWRSAPRAWCRRCAIS